MPRRSGDILFSFCNVEILSEFLTLLLTFEQCVLELWYDSHVEYSLGHEFSVGANILDSVTYTLDFDLFWKL